MEEEEQEERIPLPDKKYNYIVWGDLQMANLFNVTTNTIKGEIIFEFRPTESMRHKHQILDSDYDQETGRVNKAYPIDKCINIPSSPNTQRWFINCDYYCKKAILIELFDKETLMKLEVARKENATLRMALLRAQKNAMERETHPAIAEDKAIKAYEKGRKYADENPEKE